LSIICRNIYLRRICPPSFSISHWPVPPGVNKIEIQGIYWFTAFLICDNKSETTNLSIKEIANRMGILITLPYSLKILKTLLAPITIHHLFEIK